MSAEQTAAILAGYLAASLAAAVALIMLPFLAGLAQEEVRPVSIGLFFGVVVSIGVTFLLALVVSLPGFVVLRFGLHWLRRSDVLSFVLAGAVNAWLVLHLLDSANFSFARIIKILQDPTALFFVSVGGLAGLVSWTIERQIARHPNSNPFEVDNP